MAVTLVMGEMLDAEGFAVAALGFEVDGMFIADPDLDDSGRFEVDPVSHYGLKPQQAQQMREHNFGRGRL